MHDLGTLQSGGYRDAGLAQLELACPLAVFPNEILELGGTLEQLDLSGTGLSSLPADLGPSLPKLKVALFSNCSFRVFPRELASCPSLETVAFRNNGMEEIPEDAFPPRLRCLILSGNRLSSVPPAIGRCDHLRECMLAGNRLLDLPAEMARCKRLALLRLSCNRLEALPPWLFTLPELAFLSFSGNPCACPAANGVLTHPGLRSIAWSDLEIVRPLGSSAPGATSQGLWKQSPHYAEEVAVRLFRGSLTGDDGSPLDQMAACLAAGAHESLVTVLGQIQGHPHEGDASFQGGLVTQLLPPTYTPLVHQPLALEFTTRETLSPQRQPQPPTDQPPQDNESTPTPPSTAPPRMDARTALAMLTGIAGAAAHLHARGIAHGDLRARHVLASPADAHAVLVGGFGAATLYGGGPAAATAVTPDASAGELIERVEVLAFARLLEDLMGLVNGTDGQGRRDEEEEEEEGEGEEEEIKRKLWQLHARCAAPEVGARPNFEEVVEVLEGMMGWRGMMRIPG